MSTATAETAARFLREWHRLVAERDVAALTGALAADVSMGAPPYWQKLEGREIVRHLLGLILETIEDFGYHREWQAGGELALEFSGHVGDHQLQGIDLISLNERGEIQNLDVLIRPENAIATLRGIIAPRMAEFLAAQGAEI